MHSTQPFLSLIVNLVGPVNHLAKRLRKASSQKPSEDGRNYYLLNEITALLPRNPTLGTVAYRTPLSLPTLGAGETAEGIRAIATLAEDPDSDD